jgi:hypothetical protein
MLARAVGLDDVAGAQVRVLGTHARQFISERFAIRSSAQSIFGRLPGIASSKQHRSGRINQSRRKFVEDMMGTFYEYKVFKISRESMIDVISITTEI